MAQDVTVTLTNQQVAAGLADARYLYPDATNEDFRRVLEEAATYGPGVFEVIREWRMRRVMQEENDHRKDELAAFEALFPPKPAEEASVDVDPDPPPATPKPPRKTRSRKTGD